MSATSQTLSNAVWDAFSDVDRAVLLLLAVDVQARRILWPTAPDQIDPRKLAVLYDGLPIQSLLWDTEVHPDPRLAEPTHAALVAIDRAARAILDPFELRDVISRLDPVDVVEMIKRGREQLDDRDARLFVEGDRAYRDAIYRNAPAEPITESDSLPEADDQDYLAFQPATIAPGEVREERRVG